MHSFNKMLTRKFFWQSIRNINTKFSKEISPQAKVFIDSSFPITIEPLDYNKGHDNKINVNLQSETNAAKIKCIVKDEMVFLHAHFDDQELSCKNTWCQIEVPIRADLFVKMAKFASLNVKDLSNNIINVEAEDGKIFLKNIKSNEICISSESDVTSEGLLLSNNIKLETFKNGNIKINRAQGITLDVKTEMGIIETDSCYCETSCFTSKTGSLILNNVHKNCTVSGDELSELKLVGFDGTLTGCITGCRTASIHLSQIQQNSQMQIKNSDCLVKLQISEDVCNECTLRLNAKMINISDELSNVYRGDLTDGDYVVLTSRQNRDDATLFHLKCPNNTLDVEKLSWAQSLLMLKTKR